MCPLTDALAELRDAQRAGFTHLLHLIGALPTRADLLHIEARLNYPRTPDHHREETT
jgi:hypothetical protein